MKRNLIITALIPLFILVSILLVRSGLDNRYKEAGNSISEYQNYYGKKFLKGISPKIALKTPAKNNKKTGKKVAKHSAKKNNGKNVVRNSGKNTGKSIGKISVKGRKGYSVKKQGPYISGEALRQERLRKLQEKKKLRAARRLHDLKQKQHRMAELKSVPATSITNSDLYTFRDFRVVLEKFPPDGATVTRITLNANGNCTYEVITGARKKGKPTILTKESFKMTQHQLDYIYYEIMRNNFTDMTNIMGNRRTYQGMVTKLSVTYEGQKHTVTAYGKGTKALVNIFDAILYTVPYDYAWRFDHAGGLY